jgi:hypothetical protein
MCRFGLSHILAQKIGKSGTKPYGNNGEKIGHFENVLGIEENRLEEEKRGMRLEVSHG